MHVRRRISHFGILAAFLAGISLATIPAMAQDDSNAADLFTTVGNDSATTEQPAAAEETAESPAAGTANLSADDLSIGTPVFGSDGEKIGEVNRVTAGSEGKVTEIQVTKGQPAGLEAEAVSVPVDKITSTSDGVRLSMPSADVKALPTIDPRAG